VRPHIVWGLLGLRRRSWKPGASAPLATARRHSPGQRVWPPRARTAHKSQAGPGSCLGCPGRSIREHHRELRPGRNRVVERARQRSGRLGRERLGLVEGSLDVRGGHDAALKRSLKSKPLGGDAIRTERPGDASAVRGMSGSAQQGPTGSRRRPSGPFRRDRSPEKAPSTSIRLDCSPTASPRWRRSAANVGPRAASGIWVRSQNAWRKA
jgi:hypothetical protein